METMVVLVLLALAAQGYANPAFRGGMDHINMDGGVPIDSRALQDAGLEALSPSVKYVYGLGPLGSLGLSPAPVVPGLFPGLPAYGGLLGGLGGLGGLLGGLNPFAGLGGLASMLPPFSFTGPVTSGFQVVANPNGTFTTYEIIVRPINTTSVPSGVAPAATAATASTAATAATASTAATAATASTAATAPKLVRIESS